MKVEFYRHNIGGKEKSKVLECLDGIFLTTGSYVKKFEEKFASYLRLNHCVGLNSCTAALHLSLLALGIGPGDEVITTPMTFIATATAIMHTGAKPVFVDVDPKSALINPDLIEAAITENTTAIIPVHLYGQMCDMEEIREIANKYNLKIIEDSAHCIEGQRNGIRPGQLGDVACFSFYATKNITSGEGGAIGTNNAEIAYRVKLLRQHGISKEAADRYSEHYQHWDMLTCGWKYNMDNIQAALLLPQLTCIDENWKIRKRLYEKYEQNLKTIAQINYPNITSETKSAFHIFTIWIDRAIRDKVLSQLNEKDIGVAVNYRAIHLLSYFVNQFGFKSGDFPEAEEIGNKTISLPFYPKLKDNELDYILEVLERLVTNY